MHGWSIIWLDGYLVRQQKKALQLFANRLVCPFGQPNDDRVHHMFRFNIHLCLNLCSQNNKRIASNNGNNQIITDFSAKLSTVNRISSSLIVCIEIAYTHVLYFQLIAYWFIRIAFILAGFPQTICGFFLPTPWIFFPLGIVQILWLTHRVTRYNICYSNRKQIMKRIPKNIYLCTSDKFIAVRIRRHKGEEYMNIVQLVGCQFPAIFWCNIIIYQLCVHIFFSLVRNHINVEKIKIILRIFRWGVGIQLHIQKKLRSSRIFLSQNTKNWKFNDSMKSSIHLNCLYVHMKIFRWKNNINVFFFILYP